IATTLVMSILSVLSLLMAGIPSAALASSPTGPAAPTSSPEVRFGAVEAYESPFRARESGVTWERVIYRWDQFQPRGPTDWQYNKWCSDEQLARELAEGRKVVGVVLGTPPWLSGTDPNAAPHNLDLPFDHPDNYWGQFMRRLASQYQGRIDDWIIWNEPDIWNNGSGMQQWNGSLEQYYQLVKVAHQAIKSANPNGRVILAGLTYWWDQAFGREQYFRRFLNVASHDPTARANGFYFDVASLHLYGNPRDLYDVPRYYRRLMREYDLEKPIWVTETNVVPWDDAGVQRSRDSFRASMDEQASYLVQAFASALAAGVERVSVYKMQDDTRRPGADPYGLVRSDAGSSPRAAYQAYQVITRYMSGAVDARLYRQGGATVVRLERQGDRVSVLWNNSPAQTQVALPAIAPAATLVDKFGHAQPVSPRDGRYFVDLSAATANTVPGVPSQYHIGGSPLLLVEERGQPSGKTIAWTDWSEPGMDPGRSWTSPVTGYTVSGEWLDHYRSLGGEGLLGHPLGRVHLDPAGGSQTVQYFERGILEWHPENPPLYRIQRRLLGNLLYPGFYESPVDPADPRQRPQGDATYFPDKPGQGLGHYVANYAPDGTPTHFKEFFDSHGGVNALGFPKEEPKPRNGRWTQRFQAAVLEYHPENDVEGFLPGTQIPRRNYRVQMANLGEQALREVDLPLDW
ncbi:MAG: LGFP repeat-containing protein, partial [Chloroflexota bacterium]